MGLFSFVGKAIGTVAKIATGTVGRAALGIATGGKSEVLLKVLGGAKGKQQKIALTKRLSPAVVQAKQGPMTSAVRPVFRLAGRPVNMSAIQSATPIMPRGAPAGGGMYADEGPNAKWRTAGPVWLGGGPAPVLPGTKKKRKKRRAAAKRTTKRRKSSSRGGTVMYKGKRVSRKQAANWRRFARMRKRR